MECISNCPSALWALGGQCLSGAYTMGGNCLGATYTMGGNCLGGAYAMGSNCLGGAYAMGSTCIGKIVGCALGIFLSMYAWTAANSALASFGAVTGVTGFAIGALVMYYLQQRAAAAGKP